MDRLVLLLKLPFQSYVYQVLAPWLEYVVIVRLSLYLTCEYSALVLFEVSRPLKFLFSSGGYTYK